MPLCIAVMLGTCFTTAHAASDDETAVQQIVQEEQLLGSTVYRPALDTEGITEIRYADAESTLRRYPDMAEAVVGYSEENAVLYLFRVFRTENDILWAEAMVDDTDSVYYIPFEETKVESAADSGYTLPSSEAEEPAVSQPEGSSSTAASEQTEAAVPASGSNASGAHEGTFTITTYCPCAICNGRWAGMPTASGTTITPGRTVAVDPSVIPLGTTVYIEGIGTRIAEDTGGAIKGNRIDLAIADHNSGGTWTARVTW